jgi:hypothetical protein
MIFKTIFKFQQTTDKAQNEESSNIIPSPDIQERIQNGVTVNRVKERAIMFQCLTPASVRGIQFHVNFPLL